MLKSLIQRNLNPNFYCSLHTIIKSTKSVTSISHYSKLSCSTNNERDASNRITLDYAQLLDYVRPEMAQRIQQLLDHENYLNSLSHQIQEKKEHHEALQEKQQHKEPQPHNQRLSKLVVNSLQSMDNKSEEDIHAPQYEPGLNLQDLCSIKSLRSTFYGPSPLNSFAELGNIDKHLIKAINDSGITIPSHIQQLAIPEILLGNNCVIGAETGTGKTVAFVLPILQKLLNDKRVTQSIFSPLSKFELSKDNERRLNNEKHHPFEFDAEKKFPVFVIIEPNEHLSKQTQKVIDEILARYYDNIYYENRNNSDFYKLKTMSLHGRALLPKSNELMPDILVITPTALLTNLHKKHNANRYRAFLSKVKYIVLDEADFLTRSTSRFQIRYIFAKLAELRQQIENNPLKYKLLLPKYVREEAYGATSSLIFKQLNEMAAPQIIFVGATIPTEGTRTVAETVRNWLDKAVWIRTPGLHDVCSHIAQEFRFVPRGMELDILHQILIGLAREHLYKTLWESDDDIMENAYEDEMKPDKSEKGRHKKRKGRAKKAKNIEEIEWENKQKQLHILIFVNTKKFTRECYKHLLDNGWFNTRCIHSQLHREERQERLNDFENSVSCANNEANQRMVKKNIAINDAINVNQDDAEYKDIVNNVHLLVTSDFANRGVDFKNVDIIINCQFPNHAVDYLHRCGRTGRGARRTNNDGKVLSFFNEYDLDLAWHIQMALINQYKKILANMTQNKGEDLHRIGTHNVQLDDCFGIEQEKLSEILRKSKGYNRMSLPRDYQKTIDLTRCDLDEMDEKVLSHIIEYAKDEKWIHKQNDTETNSSYKQKLQQLIDDRKNQNRKLKMPWPYRLEFANQ